MHIQYFMVSMYCAVLSCSVLSDSATTWTAAPQAPLFLGFSRQEYWSGLRCPGNLPNPVMEARSPVLQADSLLSEPPGKPLYVLGLLCSFISQWTFRLFPCLDHCEQYCYEHKGAYIFLNYSFVWVYE